MKLEFLKSYAWRDEVKKLPRYHQIAFLASICERVIPLYYTFAEESQWEDADFTRIRHCLDEVWLYAETKELNESKIKQFLSDYDCILPDVSSIGSQYVFEARYAAAAIYCLLKFCLTSKERLIEGVGMYTHEDIIYNHISCLMEESSDKFQSNEEFNKKIYNHPFIIREMAKENKDLQRLKGMPEITSEFIKWFRNLSHEQSECVIDIT